MASLYQHLTVVDDPGLWRQQSRQQRALENGILGLEPSVVSLNSVKMNLGAVEFFLHNANEIITFFLIMQLKLRNEVISVKVD